MCRRAWRSFADLFGTGLPAGSYRNRYGYHRLLIETVRIASAKRPALPLGIRSSDERLLSERLVCRDRSILGVMEARLRAGPAMAGSRARLVHHSNHVSKPTMARPNQEGA